MKAVLASLLTGVPSHSKSRKDTAEATTQRHIAASAGAAAAAAPDEGPAKKKQKRHEGQAQVAGEDGGISLFGSAAQQSSGQDAGAALMGRTEAPKVQTHDPHEEAAVLRKAYRIKVSGGTVGAPLRDFEEMQRRFGASKRLMENLRESGYDMPTPVQRQAVPALIEGHQVLAIAPTGSGKTLAFLLPIIIKLRNLKRQAAAAVPTAAPESAAGSHPPSKKSKLLSKSKKQKKTAAEGDEASNGAMSKEGNSEAGEGASKLWPEAVKAIVLSPTHELAGQQFRVLQRVLQGVGLKASLLTAGTAAGANFSRVDVLVANPMRLQKLVETERVDCSQVRFLVLDEADKLFELGFLPQIDAILAACTHPDLCRSLFSATLPEKVEELARSVMHDPVRLTVGERNTAANSVQQRLQFVGREAGKLVALRQLIAAGLHPPVLVFVSSKERAHMLHKELMYDGVHVDSIHSDQPQAVRNAAVDNFRAGSTWLLVATDLVGRGMDFIGVNTVVNYDFPRSTTDYIHRVGRTGRGGRVGEAITFYTEDDGPYLRPIANIMKAAGCDMPDWMLQLPKPKSKKGREMRQKLKKQSAGIKNSREAKQKTGEGKRAKARLNETTQSGAPDRDSGEQPQVEKRRQLKGDEAKETGQNKTPLRVKAITLKRQAAQLAKIGDRRLALSKASL